MYLQNIRRYLDETTRGIVCFNLELPYDVLWLLDHSNVLYRPANVLIKISLVEHHVLRHPKTKVIVSQGELSSVQEAFVNSVPIVGMPFVFDQFKIVQKITDLGIAKV